MEDWSCTNNNEPLKVHSMRPLFECFKECPEEVDTHIEGTIPEWLSGELVRVGPGKFKYGIDQVKHWFDGAAIIHKFTVKEGRVSFQSRMVDSNTYRNNMAQQRITVAEFGSSITPDPCATRFERFKSWFQKPGVSDNANINVFKYGDILLTTTDSSVMQTVRTNLETIGSVDLDKTISLNLCSAHPHSEPDGSLYISGSSFKGRPSFHIARIPPFAESGVEDAREALAQAEILCTIPCRSAFHPSYSHSFGMTENYFIYCDTPVTLNVFKTVATVMRGKAINQVFNYDPSQTAIFHVINKSSGEVIPLKFQIKSLFFFHIINCYEDDSHIVVDLCSFFDFTNSDLFTEPLEEFQNDTWKKERKWASYKHYPIRLIFPLTSNLTADTNLVQLPNTSCKAFLSSSSKQTIDVIPERLLPEGQDRIDMPQINYSKYGGRKYKYFYGTGLIVNQYFANAIGKVNVEEKTSVVWRGTGDQYPSEPVFIPHPENPAEDAGVVLSSVCDVNPGNQDFLLLLDGQTFQEVARAYVPADVQVPYSIHGSYHKV